MWALECRTYNEGETKTKLFSLYVIVIKSAYSTLKSKIWLYTSWQNIKNPIRKFSTIGKWLNIYNKNPTIKYYVLIKHYVMGKYLVVQKNINDDLSSLILKQIINTARQTQNARG